MRKKLEGSKCKGRKLKLLDDPNWGKPKKRSRSDNDPQRKRRKLDKKPTGPIKLKTPEEVLTPWSKVEYPQQLLRKYRVVRKAMLNYLHELKFKTDHSYSWTANETVSHPLGTLASPVTEEYRNKDSYTFGINEKDEKVVGCRLGSTKDGN
eukprot:UN27167